MKIILFAPVFSKTSNKMMKIHVIFDLIGKNFITFIIKWYSNSKTNYSESFILCFTLVSPTQIYYVNIFVYEYNMNIKKNISPNIN